MAEQLIGRRIHINGIVQGVGFRPFIYNLAQRLHLVGWITNSSNGVDIEICGKPTAIDAFLTLVKTQPPPLSRIDEIQIIDVKAGQYLTFEIRPSEVIPGEFLPISPDVAICADCQRELFDPADRRFRYPFINCTNCGPRFSIIRDIPYDRPNTTMNTFALCPQCEREYRDPSNRRFHAQPVACPTCGPEIHYHDGQYDLSGETALQAARKAIFDGKIVAIKGLGGYHLACNASNDQAVRTLRERKKRTDKPFALMAFDLSSLQKFVEVSPQEASLLVSQQKPVVLLRKKPGSAIAESCAPGQNTLGFMLAYTPLHLLIMEPVDDFPLALVMTSGNLSEEPIAFEDHDAYQRLSPIADAFLTNNRVIQTRIDDSVFRVFQEKPYPIRRSRGYAPEPIRVQDDLPELLACGAELKNTFTLSRGKYLFLSHHIGDLENYETLKAYEEGIAYYRKIFRVQPTAVAIDLHPDYLATKFGLKLAEQEKLPVLPIQHHHAHLAACLVDNDYPPNKAAIGLTYDGTGYGTDGSIWGGEVLFGDAAGYERHFHLESMPLPGGDAAIHAPARIALAYLYTAGIDWSVEFPAVAAIPNIDRDVISAQLRNRINTPMTSSMGRLFDAVSALIGIRQTATYEGQAAIELENCCDPNVGAEYEISVESTIIPVRNLIEQITADYLRQVPISTISAKFHNTIVAFSLECARVIRNETGCTTIALSGGVWQNMTLLGKMTARLNQAGFIPLVHKRVPTNDGGISIGQIAILASYLQNS